MFATDALVVILRDFFNLCTVCICFVSKVPQINKVVQNKSAVGKRWTPNYRKFTPKCQLNRFVSLGISLSAVTLEIFRFAVLLCYNYCNGSQLLSYLEYPVLLLQQSTLVYFVLKFNNLLCTEIVLMSILVFITIALFMAEVLPKLLLTYLIVSVTLPQRDQNIQISFFCLKKKIGCMSSD